MDYILQAPLSMTLSQADILVAISSSRESSWPWDEPASPALAGGFFTAEPPENPKE